MFIKFWNFFVFLFRVSKCWFRVLYESKLYFCFTQHCYNIVQINLGILLIIISLRQ